MVSIHFGTIVTETPSLELPEIPYVTPDPQSAQVANNRKKERGKFMH